MKPSSKWLRLQLRGDQKISSRYVIIHTHFSIYRHLLEQGYNIAFYEAADYTRHEPNPVLYIKTDHDGFFDSCRKYYEHDFDLSYPDGNFELPENFRLMMGGELAKEQLVS